MTGRSARRQPLPDGLREGERDFFRELRRVVDAAGLTYRELEKKTTTARTGAAGPAFFSKSQWARWLNGQSMPPRRAVRNLVAVVDAEDLPARQLLALWDRAAVPARPDSEDDGEPGDEADEAPPRQVPAVTPYFTGRAAELAVLGRLADQAAAGGATQVVVITGTPGVGKTTLANHFCQRAADRFPDGQLHVNLRGFDPGGQPLDASAALRGFLEGLGVKPASVPADPDAQAALYRTRVNGRRLLIVLDNAREVGQVRRLIPGSPGCLVLVTSRDGFPGLLAQGAQVLTLAPFTEDDARRFLARRLGAGRVEREPAATADLVRLCARLPLALSVAAAHAAAHPRFPLSALAGELRARALDQLDTGDEETSARAVFSWSYHSLSEPGRQLFRLLGAHPGPDTGIAAAASLAAMPARPARAALRELSRAHLAEEARPGRFAVHDLLRAYAAELAAAADGPDRLSAAERRLLDHYLHTGHAAAALLAPSRDCGALAPPAPGVLTEPPGTADAAMAWFTAESRALLAACSLAARRGTAAHGWQLPWVIAPYLISQGRWDDFAATQRAAVAAAERTGDLRGLGHARHHLGYALALAGDAQAAEAHVRLALDAFTRAGDDPGRALALHGLAQALRDRGRPAEALPAAREALRLRAAHGPAAAAASSENSLGSICIDLGRYAEAIEHCEQALRLCDEAGAGGYRGEALFNLGLAHLRAGEYAEAVRFLGQAAEVFREAGEMPYLAAAFTCLAVAHRAAGNPAAARRDSATAGAILDGMPPPDAEQVRAWIGRVTGPPPASGAVPPDPRPSADQ